MLLFNFSDVDFTGTTVDFVLCFFSAKSANEHTNEIVKEGDRVAQLVLERVNTPRTNVPFALEILLANQFLLDIYPRCSGCRATGRKRPRRRRLWQHRKIEDEVKGYDTINYRRNSAYTRFIQSGTSFDKLGCLNKHLGNKEDIMMTMLENLQSLLSLL